MLQMAFTGFEGLAIHFLVDLNEQIVHFVDQVGVFNLLLFAVISLA